MGRYISNESLAALPNSGVSAGTYTNANITVNSQGIVVGVENGTLPATTITDLTDVNTTGAINGQILKFNGTIWDKHTQVLIDNTDVILTNPVSGQMLTYNGTNWVNSNINTGNILQNTNIGTTIQAWDADLDSLAALNGVGIVVRNDTNSFITRNLMAGDGITIASNSGSLNNPTISVDIKDLTFIPSVDADDDLLMIHNQDMDQVQKVKVIDLIMTSVPVAGAVTVGTGAAVLKDVSSSRIIEIRSLKNSAASLTVNLNGDNIEIGLVSTLDTIGQLTPTLNNFIVGTGSSWATKTPSEVRTAMGLGTIVTKNIDDYVGLTNGVITANIDMGGHAIINLADPIDDKDAVTKDYVDNQFALTSVDNQAGAGLYAASGKYNVGAGTGIVVNANDVAVNPVYFDGIYAKKADLSNTVTGTEGASNIGTDTKAGLNNAQNVEDALEYLNTNFPIVKRRFRQDISIFNLDIEPDPAISPKREVIHSVEVAKFPPNVDSAAFRDLLMPPDFDSTLPFTLYVSMSKEDSAAGVIEMNLSWQYMRNPGFSTGIDVAFTPGNTDAVQIVQWVIPAGTFQPFDIVTLRLARRGTSPIDTYNNSAFFWAAFLTQ